MKLYVAGNSVIRYEKTYIHNPFTTGKSLAEALLFAEHGKNM